MVVVFAEINILESNVLPVWKIHCLFIPVIHDQDCHKPVLWKEWRITGMQADVWKRVLGILLFLQLSAVKPSAISSISFPF